MGSGSYDYEARSIRAVSSGYATTHAQDARVFVQAAKREVNEGMDPKLITLRECRDNADHPNTVPIILALDETGSMGRIPVNLIRNELPTLMAAILAFCPDASLCFMAVGDDRSDQGPLQVGQFEASDELLDHWLTRSWLEGNGGGNGGESYALPWLFAVNKIVTDAWEKRGQKGLLITVGDEPVHQEYSPESLKRHFGDQYQDMVLGMEGSVFHHRDIHAAASTKWNIHHVAIGSLQRGWGILGEQCHLIRGEKDVVPAIVGIVRDHLSTLQEYSTPGSGTIASPTSETPNTPETIPTPL